MDQFQLLRGQPALNNPAINQREHELLPASANGFKNVEFYGLVAQKPHKVIEEFAAGMFNLAKNLQNQMFQMKTNVWGRKDVTYLPQEMMG